MRAILSGLLACVLACSPLALAQEEGAAEVNNERVTALEKLLQVATDRFELARWVECKAALDKLYAKNPSDQECWHLREVFGDRILRHMAFWVHKGRTLGEAPIELLKRAQSFEQARMLDPRNIEAVVKGVIASPENPKYIYELARIGPFAAPYLIDYLRAGKDEVARTNASVLLVHLGPQVVVPLTEALRAKDDVLRQHLSDILRKIKPRDTRALHQLKRIYDNKENLPTVRLFAQRALEEITQAPADSLPSAPDYMYREANRIYLGGDIVSEEMLDLSRAFWVWDAQANNKHGFLAHLDVPIFSLDDMTVQELAYEGIQLSDEKERRRFQILLASSFLAQSAEIQELSAILRLRGITMPHVNVLKKDIETWLQRLYRNEILSWSVGSSMLLDVLDKALLDGKSPVAIRALEGVQEVAGPHGWAKIEGYTPQLETPPPAEPGTEKGEKTKDAVQAEEAKEKPQPVAKAEAPKPATPEEAPAPKPAADDQMTDKKEADKEAKPEEPKAAEAPKAADEESAPAKLAHPVLACLDHPDRRVKYAAANCLQRIGLPPEHPRYKDLVPVLVDGARENAAIVCLVISNRPKVRERMAALLASKGFLAMTAPTGREGYSLAVQFPPKDAIIVDSEVQEFAYLRDQLALRQLVPGSPLPLTIITTRGRIEPITRQFSREQWEIDIRFNVSAEDRDKFVRLYDELTYVRSSHNKKQTVSILTNEDSKARVALKHAILLEAERRGRPERQTELLKLMHKAQLLSDIFATRSMFVNVFLDDELAGFNAMRTVQTLRRDPRTQHIPIALLTSFGPQGREPFVRRDFEKFLEKKNDCRLVDYDVDARDLENEIKDMEKLNPLSQEHYVRQMYYKIALDSAQALTHLDIETSKLTLSEQQVLRLIGVLKDASRKPELRAEVARVLGHFRAPRAAKTLVGVFRDEPRENVQVRAACIEALGLIDVENKHMKVKKDGLDDPAPEIRAAAARALGRAMGGIPKNQDVFDAKRPNDPRAMLREKAPRKVKEGEGEKKEGEGEKKEGEKKEGEKKEEAW